MTRKMVGNKFEDANLVINSKKFGRWPRMRGDSYVKKRPLAVLHVNQVPNAAVA